VQEVTAEQVSPNGAAWSTGQLKEAVLSFLEDFSIEATPHSLNELDSYPAYLAPGTTIYVAHPPRSSLDDVAELAVRLRGMGYQPVPHLAVRRIESDAQLERALVSLRAAGIDQAVYLGGPAGTVTLHNCRTIHGSKPNLSDAGRPLLLHTYAAADALPYTCNPLPSRLAGKVVRGKPARWADHDPRPCQMPPDWSGGYTSLFALQQNEEWSDEQRDVIARQSAEIRANG